MPPSATIQYVSPEESLYAADVAKTEMMGVERARQTLGDRLRKANAEEEIHTVVTKHGRPDGLIVGMEWYRRAREALGEPTDL